MGVVAADEAAGPVVSVSFDATKSSIHARWASEKEDVSEGVGIGSAIMRERTLLIASSRSTDHRTALPGSGPQVNDAEVGSTFFALDSLNC